MPSPGDRPFGCGRTRTRVDGRATRTTTETMGSRPGRTRHGRRLPWRRRPLPGRSRRLSEPARHHPEVTQHHRCLVGSIVGGGVFAARRQIRAIHTVNRTETPPDGDDGDRCGAPAGNKGEHPEREPPPTRPSRRSPGVRGRAGHRERAPAAASWSIRRTPGHGADGSRNTWSGKDCSDPHVGRPLMASPSRSTAARTGAATRRALRRGTARRSAGPGSAGRHRRGSAPASLSSEDFGMACRWQSGRRSRP